MALALTEAVFGTGYYSLPRLGFRYDLATPNDLLCRLINDDIMISDLQTGLRYIEEHTSIIKAHYHLDREQTAEIREKSLHAFYEVFARSRHRNSNGTCTTLGSADRLMAKLHATESDRRKLRDQIFADAAPRLSLGQPQAIWYMRSIPDRYFSQAGCYTSILPTSNLPSIHVKFQMYYGGYGSKYGQ